MSLTDAEFLQEAEGAGTYLYGSDGDGRQSAFVAGARWALELLRMEASRPHWYPPWMPKGDPERRQPFCACCVSYLDHGDVDYSGNCKACCIKVEWHEEER